MATSDATREYWLGVVLGWAEDRLMPPQYDECKAALDFAGALELAVNARESARAWARRTQADNESLTADRDALAAENERLRDLLNRMWDRHTAKFYDAELDSAVINALERQPDAEGGAP